MKSTDEIRDGGSAGTEDPSVGASRLPGRLLLHACCGPCSLEPVRLLRDRGIEPAIHYANSNISPEKEYERRRDTIRRWCESEDIELIEAPYESEAWELTAGRIGDAAIAGDCFETNSGTRFSANAGAGFAADSEAEPEQAGDRAQGGEPTDGHGIELEAHDESKRRRCRACYRVRFEESASYAARHGFDAMGTTLTVSPYQYSDIIAEELARACEKHGISCFFEDYSPHYREATRRSREMGMYRQRYCGCRFSEEEARIDRERRELENARRKSERARELEAENAKLEQRRRERAEYDARKARRRAVLKTLREERKRSSEDCTKRIADTSSEKDVLNVSDSSEIKGEKPEKAFDHESPEASEKAHGTTYGRAD